MRLFARVCFLCMRRYHSTHAYTLRELVMAMSYPHAHPSRPTSQISRWCWRHDANESHQVRDLFAKKDLGEMSSLSADVNSHGVVLLRLSRWPIECAWWVTTSRRAVHAESVACLGFDGFCHRHLNDWTTVVVMFLLTNFNFYIFCFVLRIYYVSYSKTSSTVDSGEQYHLL